MAGHLGATAANATANTAKLKVMRMYAMIMLCPAWQHVFSAKKIRVLSAFRC